MPIRLNRVAWEGRRLQDLEGDPPVLGPRPELCGGSDLHDGEVDAGDVVLCIGTAPVNKHIPALLGFGLDVFDVACAANQGDIERLGNLRPAERKRMVDTVIGLDRLEEVARWAGEEARGYEKQVEAIERSGGQEPVKPLEEFDPRPCVGQGCPRGVAPCMGSRRSDRPNRVDAQGPAPEPEGSCRGQSNSRCCGSSCMRCHSPRPIAMSSCATSSCGSVSSNSSAATPVPTTQPRSGALKAAIGARDPPRGCVHHSDRGSQYASDDYRAALQKHGLTEWAGAAIPTTTPRPRAS